MKPLLKKRQHSTKCRVALAKILPAALGPLDKQEEPKNFARSNNTGTTWNKVSILRQISESTEWPMPDKLSAALCPADTSKSCPSPTLDVNKINGFIRYYVQLNSPPAPPKHHNLKSFSLPSLSRGI